MSDHYAAVRAFARHYLTALAALLKIGSLVVGAIAVYIAWVFWPVVAMAQVGYLDPSAPMTDLNKQIAFGIWGAYVLLVAFPGGYAILETIGETVGESA